MGPILENCDKDGVSTDNPLIVGFMEKAELVAPFKSMADCTLGELAKFMNRSCYEVRDVPFELFGTQKPDIAIPDIEVFYVSLDTSVFDRFQYLVNTAWISTPDTYLISKKPDKYVIGVSTFVECEDMVKDLVFTSITLVAVCTTLFAFTKIKRPTNYLSLFLKFLWNISSPILDQAMWKVPNNLPTKILLGPWLLSTLIIGIYVASFLRSKLSLIGYQTIDTLEDFLRFPEIQPVLFKYLNEHLVLKKRSTYNEAAMTFLNRIEERNSLINFDELLTNVDFYRELRDGKKALFVHQLFWVSIFELAQTYLNDDEDKVLYYGKQAISSGVMTAFYNRSLSVETQENMNLLILRIGETMYPYQFLFRNAYLVERYTWKREFDSDFSPTSWKDMEPIFKLTFLAQISTCAVIAFEIFYVRILQFTCFCW